LGVKIKKMSNSQLSSAVTVLKTEEKTTWLKDVSSVTLQQSLRNLDTAFMNFFQKRTEYPNFKSRHNRQSASYPKTGFKLVGESLTLAKMKEPFNIRWSRALPREPAKVTVSKDSSDRYFVSFSVDRDSLALPTVNKQIGVDLGITDTVITSDGFKSGNPKITKQYERKLTRAQRKLAKCEKGSSNRKKAKLAVAKIHAKIAEVRSDFSHKLTTKLVRENDLIAIEDLQVKNMIKNHKLAKAIADVAWGELVRQFEYKGKFYGREIVQIDKFFPSSKRCSESECGYISKNMPLNIRKWICPKCKTEHDRDINAAKNILKAGLAILAGCDQVRQP